MTETFDILKDLVAHAHCKKGWSFRFFDEDGALRLVITVRGFDSYDEDRPLIVSHFFPVPIATYNQKSWQRWMFEMCRRVENHELGEWFRIGDVRPFAPLHGPGEDPYTVHEYRNESDARVLQDGTTGNEKIKVSA